MSEKILFGELSPGEIVVVDCEGEGEERKLTFRGEAKPPAGAGQPAGGSGQVSKQGERGYRIAVTPPSAFGLGVGITAFGEGSRL